MKLKFDFRSAKSIESCFREVVSEPTVEDLTSDPRLVAIPWREEVAKPGKKLKIGWSTLFTSIFLFQFSFFISFILSFSSSLYFLSFLLQCLLYLSLSFFRSVFPSFFLIHSFFFVCNCLPFRSQNNFFIFLIIFQKSTSKPPNLFLIKH